MKILHRITAIGLFCFFATTLEAARWPKHLRDSYPLNEINAEKFIDTLRGTCEAQSFTPSLWDSGIPGEEYLNIESNYFKNGKFNVSLFLNRGKKEGELKPSPLLIIMPGIFAASADITPASFAHFFHQHGFHVLIIPNSWSREVIEKSAVKMGDVEREADWTLEAIKQTISFISERKGLLKSHLLAMSYGSFVAAAALAKDLDTMIDGHKLLVSPPIDLLDSLKRLDALISIVLSTESKIPLTEQLSTYKKLCTTNPQKILDPKKPKDKQLLSDITLFSLGAVTKVGFYLPLRNAMIAMDSFFGFNFRKSFSHQEEWEAKLRFSYYLENYSPELLEKVTGDKRLLKYWLEQIPSHQKPLILISKNDFINDPDSTKEFGEESLILPSGGHLQFVNLSWAKSLLLKLFWDDLP